MTSFQGFAEVCQRASSVPGSLEKVDILASYLRDLEGEDLEIAASFLAGDVLGGAGGELGVGPSILYDAIARASGKSQSTISDHLRATGDPGLVANLAMENQRPLSLSTFTGSHDLSMKEVHERFLAVGRASGRGSQETRIKNLQYLFSQASPLEAQFIARMAMEDLRIGVGEGLLRDSIARAFDQEPSLVERGFNLTNDPGSVARYARKGRLQEMDIILNRPLKMMLAQIGEGIPQSLQEGATAVEWKFDGARVQIHKDGEKVRLFSRRLEDVTGSLPEIIKVVMDEVRASRVILDGEAVAMGEDGRPRPFQDLLRRFRRKYHVDRAAKKIPIRLNLFDLLYLEGKSLLDLTLRERRKLLCEVVDEEILASQVESRDPDQVSSIYDQALAAGHEGIMLKNPESTYTPGKRGKNWLKIKPVMEALDLVVIGARWGEGRRARLLGSYQLACHNPETGALEEIGWVATGFDDEMLADLTELFSELILVQGEGMEVKIAPKMIFEVAYEEIQQSPNYSSGFALRFPRLIAVRDDKSLEDADTLKRVEEIYRLQRGRASPKN